MAFKDLNMIVVFTLRLLMDHLYLLLYVDDMLISTKSREQITALKKLLNSEFDMKDLGAAKKILDMEITRDRNSGLLFLSE